MLGLVLVNFMYGHSGMDNRWLNGLLLDNGLDGLEGISQQRPRMMEIYLPRERDGERARQQ